MTRTCGVGLGSGVALRGDRVGRFEQRFGVEHELRVSLRVEYCPGERSHAARGGGQWMHDHFTGMDHAVHSDREEFRVGLNDGGQARARIDAGLKRPPHRVGEPDKWNRAAFEDQ